MDNNNNLSDELLKQDSIEPVGVSDTERIIFKAMLDNERRRARCMEWFVHIPIWILTISLSAICFSERLSEALHIPFIAASLGLVLVVFVILVPASLRFIYRFKSRKAKLKQIQAKLPKYAKQVVPTSVIIVGEKDGKPLVNWPAVITIGMTLSLVLALGIGCLFSLLAGYWSTPLMVYGGLIGLAMTVVLVYQGIRIPLKDSVELPAGRRNIWKIIIRSKITKFATATVAIGFILFSAYIAQYEPDPQDTVILGQASLYSDSFAALRILVRNHATGRPIQNATVHFAIRGDKVRKDLGKFETTEDGSISENIYIPSIPLGKYELVVASRSRVGEDRIVRHVEIKRPYRVYVITDKPVYQPGQTLHMRAMVLNRVSLKPFANQPILFEVEDPKGNKAFKTKLTTSKYGIAATDFEIASEVNMGRYRIRAVAGDVETEKIVTVKHYVLPKFKVEVSADKPYYLPSEKIRGIVKASYFFGKPVANSHVEVIGRTVVEKPTEIFKITGTTNEDGEFAFDTKLAEYFTGMPLAAGNAFLEIGAVVTDTAGHEEKASEHRVVAQQPINIHVIAESGQSVTGVENIIYIMTTYPDGKPAICRVLVNEKVLITDQTGIAVLKTTPQFGFLRLYVEASDWAGHRGTLEQTIDSSKPSQDFLLRTDKAVYLGGETIYATILSATPEATFFLDIIKDEQTILTKTLSVEKGKGTLAVDLPPSLFGTLKINAYTITAEGQSTTDSRIAYVHQPNQLKIETSLDKSVYRPGETANVDFKVTNDQGIPTPAALSLSVVDEAVFYISENRPGLLEQFFLADEELLKPAYQVKFTISPEKLLSGEDDYQTLAKALFSGSVGAPTDTLNLDDLEEYLGPHQLESIRESIQEGRYNQLLNDPRYAKVRDILMPENDYTLQATTYHNKIARAEAFRERYFGIVKTAFIVLIAAGFVLGLFGVLFYSTFKLIRTGRTEGLDAVHAAVQKAINGIVYSYAILFFFPIVTYLTVPFLCAVFGFDIEPESIFLGAFVINLFLAVVLIILQLKLSLGLAHFPETSSIIWKIDALLLIYITQYVITRMIIIDCVFDSLEEGFAILAVLASFVLTLIVYSVANVIAGNVASKYHVELRRPSGFVSAVVIIIVIIFLIGLLMPSLSYCKRYALAVTAANELHGMDAALELYEAEHPPVDKAQAEKSAPRVRRYFPETLLWYPELITDDNGKATLNITTADSITTWRMNIDAVSAAGKLCSSETDIRVFQDFFVDLDLPIALTRNDEVSVPVACYNYLQQRQTIELNLQAASWCELLGPSQQQVNLSPNEVKSVMFRIKAKEVGSHELTLIAHGDKLSDAVQRRIDVRPDGSEVESLQSGILTLSAEHTFYIPSEAIPNSQSLILKLYPSTFSEVVEGLENIFRMPFGCFEQTSSTTYPNVMALQYMKRTNQITPEIEVKARKFITAGYQRLLTYEVTGGGFDWFGHPPADETLTAYGILEFTDMSKVHNVDQVVIDRASRWLMSKQHSNGSWSSSKFTETLHNVKGNLKATAYITWALAEAGQRGKQMDASFAYLRQHLGSEDHTYTIALAANAFLTNDSRDVFGRELLGRLRTKFQIEDDSAYLSSHGAGAIYSRGRCLDIETTSLATLAMMKAHCYPDTVKKALTWISKQKDQYGTWYSTQATILAMKALIAGTGQALGRDIPSNIKVTVNGNLADKVRITPETSDLLHMIVLTSQLKSGENKIEIKQDENVEIPYQLVGTYWVPEKLPTVAPKKELEIQVDYDRTRLAVDDVLKCTVKVIRNDQTPIGMAIIDSGIPPGFKVDTSAFNNLVESQTLAKYELTGNQCILYVRNIKPGQPLRFSYDLKALYPIRAKIPPARVYEYYKPENEARTLYREVLVEEK